MSSQILLSGGDKWYSYSGEVFGDVTVPATISMVLIPNTGLRDSYTKIQPYYAKQISSADNTQLGIQILLNDVIIYNVQTIDEVRFTHNYLNAIELFVPRQSKLQILSINTSANNTQVRGVNLIGYYL